MKRLFLSAILSITLGILLAQTAQERPFRFYNTQSIHKHLIREHPDFALNIQALEQQIGAYGATGDTRLDTICLVFHILYGPEQPHPDEEQILKQVEVLNQDFGSNNTSIRHFSFDKIQEMAKKAVSPGIFFCLPVYDVHGRDLSPIRFIQTPTEIWKDDDAIKSGALGGADPMDTRHYLNIWVGQLDNSVSGYAQMPGGPDKTDGIVIDPRFFGVSDASDSPYNKGKTLTHLIGSYLGLYELWNELTPCGDDKVDDTPIHNAPNYALGSNYHHVSLCDSTRAIEMVINFMDNTDDEALSMFTQGQKNRMKASLSPLGLRAELSSWNHSCQAEGQTATSVHNGIDGHNLLSAFRLFPNPAKNTINLEVNISRPGTVVFSTFNMLGERIAKSSYNLISGSQIFNQDCDEWSPGMYFIEATFEDGSSITRPVYLDKP